MLKIGKSRTAPVHRRAVAIVLALVCGFGSPAFAGFAGKTVQLFKVTTNALNPSPIDISLNTHVVGGQVEYDAFYDYIDIADDTVTLGNNDRHCSSLFGTVFCPIAFMAPGHFLGFKIVDRFDSIAPIAGVSLLSSSIAGFDITDISFSENEIVIGIQDTDGVYWDQDVIPFGQAVLFVQFSETTVTEPLSAALFALGLIWAAGLRRNRESRPLRAAWPRWN